jgi:hypothetical protein
VKHAIIVYLPWFISCSTLLQTYMVGNKHHQSWGLGLFNQVLWSTWIVVSQNWGLMLLNISLWVLYFRNHRKWIREHRERTAEN